MRPDPAAKSIVESVTTPRCRHARKDAFSLAEVAIAMGIASFALMGVIYGYTSSSRRAEWNAYSLAAHSLAMQGIEQMRAAKWDLQAWPMVDELGQTNFLDVNILDIPISKTNIVYATNFVQVADISSSPPLKMIRVDCVWMFVDRGPFTNTVVAYRAPDQ